MQAPAQQAEDAVAREIERVIAREVGDQRLKALLETPGGFDQPLWTLAVEQGWPGLAFPEQVGGLGLGWRDLAEVAQVLGHATVSLPLIQGTVIGRALLSAKNADQLSSYAQKLAAGEALAAITLMDNDDAGLPLKPSLRLENDKLSGVAGVTAFGAVADIALVRADKGGRAVLALVDLEKGVERDRIDLVDNARGAASLKFSGAQAVEIEGVEALEDILATAVLMTAFEQIGGAAACMELAKAYAMEHKAFGQPIGAFQAIKHKMADIYTAIEIAKGCALEALEELETGKLSIAAAAAARISANRAYDFAAQEAIQVHGGMGITWEGFLHHHYRRARSLALELGSTAYWRNVLLDELLAGEKS